MSREVEATIDRVLSGEVEAYAEIVRRYQNDIWRVVACLVRDTAATEDLVQQTFVNAYQNLHKYQAGRNFGAWLKTVARNLVLNELRRRDRERRRLRHYRRWLELRLHNEAESDRAERALERALAECREALSPTASRALALRYERGLSFAQIAEQLERSVAATRQLLVRVRLALRQCIQSRRSA